MNSFQWQDSTVEVQARFVPRWLWTTASMDVIVDGECVLRTGGQFQFVGSQATTFTQAGAPHVAELSWEASLSWSLFSLPYRLRIDGVPVAVSRVRIRNWPLGLTAVMGLAAVLTALFQVVFASCAG